MKKTLLLIFAVFAFFGIVLYAGNLFVIGDHIGQMATTVGFPATAAKWIVLAWDLVGLAFPALLLFWVITKNIYGYGELNVDVLLASKDERQLSAALKHIAEQPESPESTLDKHNIRRRCTYLVDAGDRFDKQSFLKDYFCYCEEDSRELTSRYALFAAVSVVLSPRSAGDALALLVWQCRIISSTLRIYGGRPSKTMVLRLYAKVLMHSFVAGSLDEVFDQFAFGAVDIKMLSSLTQALAAVATCVRTSALTRYYINHGLKADRKKALKEALKEITEGIVDVIRSDELNAAWKKGLKCGGEIAVAVGKEIGKYAIPIITPTAEKSEEPAEQEPVTTPCTEDFRTNSASVG